MSNVYEQVRSDALYAALKSRQAFVTQNIKVWARTNSTWASLIKNVFFPRDKGLPGLIGPTNYADQYDKKPWLAGLFYTSKLATGKEASLTGVAESMKNASVLIEQIDTRTEDILLKVEEKLVAKVMDDKEDDPTAEKEDYTVPSTPHIIRVASQRVLKETPSAPILSKKT